jgi:hypothetical protein
LFSVSKYFATVYPNEHDPDFMPCSLSPVEVLWLQMSLRKNRLSSRGSQPPWQKYFASPAKKKCKRNCAEDEFGKTLLPPPPTHFLNKLSKPTEEGGRQPPLLTTHFIIPHLIQ